MRGWFPRIAIAILATIVVILNLLWTSDETYSFPSGYNMEGQMTSDTQGLIKVTNICVKNNSKSHRTKDFQPVTIGVVLQVYKRKSLHLQLETLANQTLLPKTIIVFQNGFYVDVSQTILDFRKKYPDLEIQHIASSKNLRFHGRFYIAYMMRETYVSLWDDDIFPKTEWLEHCVEQSKANSNALIVANGRTFLKLFSNIRPEREEFIGKNDFGGHTWTLPREFLKFYLEMEMPTLYTGEDMLLSYAMQQQGIDTIVPKMEGEKAAINEYKIFGNDVHASFRENDSPRWYLFCSLIQDGFKTLRCKNCNNVRILKACLKKFGKNIEQIERKEFLKDDTDNKHVSWSVKNYAAEKTKST